MANSYRIFKVFGISVELHISFILFFMLLIGLEFLNSFDTGLKSFIFLFILFLIVLLHELCHSIVAIRYKFKVNSITLYPIGGAANVEIQENPKAEFFISLAGPFFNFVFAWLCFIILFLFASDYTQYLNYDKVFGIEFDLSFFGILGLLAWVNLILGAFNLFLPAFPMDGGRVLRAVLANYMNYVKATKIASMIGKISFVLMGVIGFITINIFLILIAVILFFAADTESKFVEMKAQLKGLKAGELALNLREIDGNLKLKDILFLRESFVQNYKIFPVFSENKITGVLNLDYIDAEDQEKYVNEVARKNFAVIDYESDASESFEKILSSDLVIVARENIVAGYITRDSIRNYIEFMSKFKK